MVNDSILDALEESVRSGRGFASVNLTRDTARGFVEEVRAARRLYDLWRSESSSEEMDAGFTELGSMIPAKR